MNRLYGLNRSVLYCISSDNWDESIDISRMEIIPFHYHRTWRQRIIYGRILIDGLTKIEIKTIFEEVNAREIPDIIDKEDRIEIQHTNKPSLIILKKDGRIYCENSELQKFDRRLIEHQASILITILNKGKRVDFLTRKNEGRKSSIQFLEETEGKEQKVGFPTIKNRSLFISSNFTPSASKRK